MMFLGNLPSPAPGAIENWLLAGAAVLAIIKYGLDLWKEHFREDPRPSATYVTITQFDAKMKDLSDELAVDRAENKRDHEGIFSKIGGHERGINTSLRGVEVKVAALEERSATTNTTLVMLGSKVDRIVERLKA